MKATKIFSIALLVTLMASLVGCANEKFRMVDQPITIGDKTYTALITERVNTWGTNAVSLNLVESKNKIVKVPQPQMCYSQQPVQEQPQQTYAPQPCPQQPVQEQPQQTYAPQPCPNKPAVVYYRLPCIPMQVQPAAIRPVACTTVQVRLKDSRVINSNNQGSTGLWVGAFQGAVGDAIMGGSVMGAAAILRPSNISVRGGNGSASASSAAASAASATPTMAASSD